MRSHLLIANGVELEISPLQAHQGAEQVRAVAADPIEAIKFRMEQQGRKPKDLQPMMGDLNRVYGCQ